MYSFRFIAAFAEILISPAILLYMAAKPVAMADWRIAPQTLQQWQLALAF